MMTAYLRDYVPIRLTGDRPVAVVGRSVCAFTLVEMLIVVVIITVLAGGVVVSLQGRYDVHALDLAAKDLASTISYGIRQSTIRQTDHRLAFYDRMRTYRVEMRVSPFTEEFVPVAGRAGMTRSLPEGVQITGITRDGQDIEPLPEVLSWGGGDSGFYGVIELADRQAGIARIEVVPRTGQVHVIK